ncbi:MAG: hypothetical protein R2724_09385 [Bryobacterales bacterium]
MVIKTAQGVEGLYGPVDAEACVVVDRQLKQLVIGQDALAVETGRISFFARIATRARATS